MDKLKSELRTNLMANLDVSVLKEDVWQLPAVTYGVSFDRVKRLKMDILMKMLLLAFQETDIRRAAALADMLFVEELFIRDLIDKMQRTHLIRLDAKGYRLTDKGYGHLEKGIFEETMDGDEALVSYSAIHDDYRLSEDIDPEAEKEIPPYRYAVEGEAETERIHELLSTEKNSAEEGFQIIVTDITECEELGADYIPCIEFQLYDQKQDIFYARVWNTGVKAWDETLGKQIEEREIVQWRETMDQEKAKA